MSYRVTIIPGDGTGPELSLAAKRCVDATGVKIEWEEVEAGQTALDKHGQILPQAALDSIKKNKVALKGPIITPIGTGFRSVNVAIRQALDLYACVRPAKYYPGVRSQYRDIDLVIIRENSEDLYAGIEFEQGSPETAKIIKEIERYTKKSIRPDSAVSIKPISRYASERIVEFAFEYATRYNRKKVTAVHKANIMKFSDGLFLRTAREVASRYANKVQFEEAIVDNMAMQLVQKPRDYDVLVLPNLYGDIISDLCAGIIGGLGVAPGANIGKDMAVFEAVHGAAPKYAGLNKVNPTAMILSGVLMLRYLGEDSAAEKLENAVKKVLLEGKYVTYDLKPNRDDPASVGTQQMADAIINNI
ncbi:MAG: isocitrate/isopropylmalate dehydrogenase family protein [Candidatus Omnitrophota bacterium]